MFKIKGNGLDALVLAAELSRIGIPFSLAADREKLGGHFRGFVADCGTIVDAGMVLLEKDVRDVNQKSISDYQGEAGQRIRPFLGEVFDWLDFELKPQDVTVGWQGGLQPDYFISDNLQVVSMLEPRDRAAAEKELSRIIGSTNFHPRDKLSDAGFRTTSLSEVLSSSIGPTLASRLFSRWLEMYDPKSVVSSADHRLIWVPLYWPETMLEAIRGESSLKPLVFLSPQEGSLAYHLRKLASALSKDADASGGPSVESVIDLSRAPSVQQRSSRLLKIVHFCLRENISGTEFLPDAPHGFSRIHFSQGTRVSENVEHVPAATLEAPGSMEKEKNLKSNARLYLESRSIEVMCDGHVLEAAVPLSTANSTSNEHFNVFESRFGEHGSNFNDQVVRGIATARAIVEKVSE